MYGKMIFTLFITNLIRLYDVYDNELLIKDIFEMAYSFINLINDNKILHDIDNSDTLQFIKEIIKNDELNLPSFIIPIVGVKKKLFDELLTESGDTIITTTEKDVARIYNLLHDTSGFSSKKYRDNKFFIFSMDFSSFS